MSKRMMLDRDMPACPECRPTDALHFVDCPRWTEAVAEQEKDRAYEARKAAGFTTPPEPWELE